MCILITVSFQLALHISCLFYHYSGIGQNMWACFVFLRADLIPVSGHVNDAATQHVFYGPTARESCVWDVLPGCGALPQLLLAFSYCLLPLWESVSHILQVRPHTVTQCFAHRGWIVSNCPTFHIFISHIKLQLAMWGAVQYWLNTDDSDRSLL